MQNFLKLIEEGKASRLQAGLLFNLPELTRIAAEYDALTDRYLKNQARRGIAEGVEPSEWREHWGVRPVEESAVVSDQCYDVQSELFEEADSLLDRLMAALSNVED